MFKWYDFILSWLFAIVFLQAAFPHWGNPYFFLGSVYAYKMVDPGVGQIVAMVFPIIQMGLAFCFLTRVFLHAAHLIALGLFLCFAAVQTIAFVRGLDITCGCFGPGHESTIGPVTLSTVYFLLIGSVVRNAIVFLARKKEDAIGSSPQ